MKKSRIVILALFCTLILYQFINWIIYKDIEVTNYSELISKAKYGQITHSDLRSGAFDLIENSLCLMIKDELTKECISDFQRTKNICADKIFGDKNLKGFDQDQTDNLIRLFNVCRQSSFHSAT